MDKRSSYPRFAALAELPDTELPLAESALIVAVAEYPGLEVDHYLSVIDGYADVIQAESTVGESTSDLVERVRDLLFDRRGFLGNAADFYAPDNSFLNRVIDTRQGIPITLSVLFLEVCWRVGVPMVGVSLPGRFMVGLFEHQHNRIYDPFGGGHQLTTAQIEAKLKEMFGAQSVDHNLLYKLLRPTTSREILSRILRNLKSIYATAGQFDQCLAAIDRMLLLTPDEPTELRDRGFVLSRLDCIDAARADLLHYLELCPDANDAADIERWLKSTASAVRRLN